MSKPTAKDVAQAAGVSLSTVDRVLNGRGGVAEDKERRVIEWARRLRLDRALSHHAARTLRIAVLVQPPDNPFHAAIQRGFAAANRDFPEYNLQFRIHHVVPGRPREAVELIKALGPGHDGLLIVTAHHDSIAAALGTLGRQGKLIITLATDIKGAGNRIYVGPDNMKAGRIAGDLMGRFLGKTGGDVMMIAGMLTMVGHQEREEGFSAVLQERYPQCLLREVLESRERSERAGDLVFDALRNNPRIRGIYNASAGALPIVRAINELGRREDMVFITHELTEERRQLLREGMIDAVIDQGPLHEVRTVVDIVATHFGRRAGEPVSPTTPIHIHTIENC